MEGNGITLNRMYSSYVSSLPFSLPPSLPPLPISEAVPTGMFFQYNTSLGPPFRVLVDTNFINFSIKNKLEVYKAMMDCLLAKCIPCKSFPPSFPPSLPHFLNFSIKNKLEVYKAMMDCLLAKCIPCKSCPPSFPSSLPPSFDAWRLDDLLHSSCLLLLPAFHPPYHHTNLPSPPSFPPTHLPLALSLFSPLPHLGIVPAYPPLPLFQTHTHPSLPPSLPP